MNTLYWINSAYILRYQYNPNTELTADDFETILAGRFLIQMNSSLD
jgi:hypothetical protein